MPNSLGTEQTPKIRRTEYKFGNDSNCPEVSVKKKELDTEEKHQRRDSLQKHSSSDVLEIIEHLT